ncbi:F-BAR domain only protein 1, partial [Lonchura striata]
MKHGQISTKELADFVRERAAIEENYAKAMVKLSKMATNGTQLGTFAPLWEVFRISSDKLALCHLELMKKLHDLIKEISRYGEEQGRVHKKSKEEVSGTLEAVQLLHGVAQLLPKSKESYHSKCQEYERLRKEGTSQKEIDKAELKSRKAGEALRRAVDKYNAARADFEQRMLDSAMRFQEVEEAHLRHMKGLIGSYSHSVEDTHVQIGQVHEEFKQNVENIGTEMLLRRFAESKGTGRERPGEAGGSHLDGGGSLIPANPSLIPGALDFDEYRLAPPQEGKTQEEPEQSVPDPGLEPDSDYDEDEPRKFYVHIKPVQPPEASSSAEAAMEQLKATVGNLILAPGVGVSLGDRGDPRNSWGHLTPVPFSCRAPDPGKPPQDTPPLAALFGPPLESAFEAEEFPAPRPYVLTSSSSPFSSSPENVEDSGLDSPSHPAPGPSPDSRPWTPQPGTPQSPGPKPEPPLPPPASTAWTPRPRSPSGRLPEPPNFAVFSGPGAEGLWGDAGAAPRDSVPPWPSAAPRDVPLVAPPRRSRTKRPPAGPAAGSNSDLSRSLSPSPSWSCGPSHSAPASLGERGFFSVAPPALGACRGDSGGLGWGSQPCADPSAPSPGLSRGPSPVVLGSQDALPVATAFTEYVHAYFKGHDADSCLVKVTGELTMSFPAGIVRVFGGPAVPPVLSFRLLNAGAIEQFLPNAELLYSDPSQSDPSTKDFWLNMAALTGHLQKQAEQSPAASYYNVALLKYQFSRLGPSSAPLRLCVHWDCAPGATRVSVEYGYNAAALALPVPLGNVHVLLPVEEPLSNLRLQPAASWNLEEKRLLWKLLDVPGAPGQGGCGRLSASWEPLAGPSKPSPVAAQFSSEGSTLSGVEVELAGAGYRMSLVKKRFAT